MEIQNMSGLKCRLRAIIILLSLLTIALSCKSNRIQSQPFDRSENNKHYSAALGMIMLEIDSLIGQKNTSVSQEVIAFENYADFFESDLPVLLWNTTGDILSDTIIVGRFDSDSKGERSSPDNVLFFSELKESYFFAELFIDCPKKNFSYVSRPFFGESYVFLFKEQDGGPKLIRRRTLHYN